MPARNAPPDEISAYMRSYRWQRIAENKCTDCGKVRDENEKYLICARCYAKRRAKYEVKRAEKWAENPRFGPKVAVAYPYGKAGERLDYVRSYRLRLDQETFAAALKLTQWRRLQQPQGHEGLPGLTSGAVRDAIRSLEGIAVPRRAAQPTIGAMLGFLADKQTRRVINAQVMRTNSFSVSACIRDLIVYAAAQAPAGCVFITVDGVQETKVWMADSETEQ